MEATNGAAGAVCLARVVRNHKSGPAEAFDDSRCSDANNAAMPAVAVDHHAIGISQRGLIGHPSFNRSQNAAFLFLTLAVELVEALGDFAGAPGIFHAEEFDYVLRDIHPTGGV